VRLLRQAPKCPFEFLEIGPRGELTRRRDGPRVRLLHRILCVGRVSDEVAGQVVERVRVGQRLASESLCVRPVLPTHPAIIDLAHPTLHRLRILTHGHVRAPFTHRNGVPADSFRVGTLGTGTSDRPRRSHG